MSTPYNTDALSSPPWAPIPGIKIGEVGHKFLTIFSCSGTVAPTTRPKLPWPHSVDLVAKCSYNGMFAPSVCTTRSCKSLDPGLDPLHQMNAPYLSSETKASTVSLPPQAFIVTASNPQVWNIASAYAALDGPMSPRLQSPMMMTSDDWDLIWFTVLSRATNPSRPRHS